jgi:hypothetical protein
MLYIQRKEPWLNRKVEKAVNNATPWDRFIETAEVPVLGSPLADNRSAR